MEKENIKKIVEKIAKIEDIVTKALYTIDPAYSIRYDVYVDLVAQLRQISANLQTEDILKNHQDILRSQFDSLQLMLNGHLYVLGSKTVVEATDELFDLPIATWLSDAWEELTGKKADRRIIAMDQGCGNVHLLQPDTPMQDGFMALAPLFVGAPIYQKAIKFIAETKDGVANLRDENGNWDSDTMSRKLSLFRAILFTGRFPQEPTNNQEEENQNH